MVFPPPPHWSINLFDQTMEIQKLDLELKHIFYLWRLGKLDIKYER